MTIPKGLCQCGCGQPTKPCKQSVTALGLVKGEPRQFVQGHSSRGVKPWNRSSEHDYVVDGSGCWRWQLRIDASGYAITSVNSYPVRAARLFYERVNGPIGEGLQIDHLCRTRDCVNPAHLEAVTPAENVRRRPATKLTAEMAVEIVRSDEAGVAIAERLGISPQQVCNIRKGRSWADVTGVAA